MESAGGHDGNRQGNRRPPPETPKSGKLRKRMKGSGSGSEPAAVVAEAEEQTKEVEGKCSECGREFFSMKALFGHMRCHPERNWRGIHPPVCTIPAATVAGESKNSTTVEQEVATSLVLLSGHIPRDAAVGPVVVSSTSKSKDKINYKGKEKVREGEEEKEMEIFPTPILIPDTPPVSPVRQPPPLPRPPSKDAMVTVLIEEVVDQGHFECSGCKRVFDSHQALGGHRASHKTIKGCYATGRRDLEAAAAGPDRRGQRNPELRNPEERREERSMALERRAGGGRAEGVAVSVGREYKCCVCSKAFSTGQALGGHMRWHLERNQIFEMAFATAARNNSSSQLRWRSSRGEGSSSNPQGGVGSLYSTGRMAPYLAMKRQDQQGTIPPLQQVQGQGAGNIINPINTNTSIPPQAYGSWSLGKDSAAAGSPSDVPQSHGSSSFPTTSTIPRWIHRGEGQQRVGFSGVTSPINPQNVGQMMRRLVAGLTGVQQHHGSGVSSARNPQNLSGSSWLQPSGSGEQQAGPGTEGCDETSFPSTHVVPFQGRRDIMHGLSFSSGSPTPNPNSNVSIEESRRVWITPSSTDQVLTERSRKLERAPQLEVAATSSRAVQALASQQRGFGTLPTRPVEEEEGGSSSPSSSRPPSSSVSSSSSSSSEIDLELKLGR